MNRLLPRVTVVRGGPPPGATARFRRSQVAPRRRRSSRLGNLLRLVLGPAAWIALPGAAAVWALTSPHFALADVEVAGTRRVPAEWVAERVEPLAGTNLLLLRAAEVGRPLAEHPWVAGVAVAKRLPAHLTVEVQERQPAALVVRGGELWYAEADGRLIAPAAEGGSPTAELPLYRDGASEIPEPAPAPDLAGALEVASDLARAEPAWAEALTEIALLGEGDYELRTAALPFPLRIRAGQVRPRVERLASLLPEIRRRYPKLAAVDLRFSRRIVLEPLTDPAQGGA